MDEQTRPARHGVRGGCRAPRHLAGDHRRRRSRRRARRPWRAPARQPALSVDDARAAGGDGTGCRRLERAIRRSARGASSTPCSIGPASHAAHSLRASASAPEVVLGEAMKPFLGYGWQPQIMAVDGREKAIFAGTTEVYDLVADPGEAQNLGAGANLPGGAAQGARRLSRAVAGGRARARERSTDEARRKLASLGYVSASAPPVVRKDAPRPADMAGCSRLSTRRRPLRAASAIREVIPLLEKILRRGSVQSRRGAAAGHGALVARPRRAGARGVQGAPRRSRRTRRTSAPTSRCTTREARTGSRRCRCSSASSPRSPDRLPAVEALAVVRERQGRMPEALVAAAEDPRAASAHGSGPGAARPAGDAAAADTAGHRIVREGARASAGPHSRTISSWACCTSQRAASPTRATPSTASRRRIPTTRWRSSSARRSACC